MSGGNLSYYRPAPLREGLEFPAINGFSHVLEIEFQTLHLFIHRGGSSGLGGGQSRGGGIMGFQTVSVWTLFLLITPPIRYFNEPNKNKILSVKRSKIAIKSLYVLSKKKCHSAVSRIQGRRKYFEILSEIIPNKVLKRHIYLTGSNKIQILGKCPLGKSPPTKQMDDQSLFPWTI